MQWLMVMIMLFFADVGIALAQQQVLSLESGPSAFQAVRPQGLLNNTVAIRPLYSLPVLPCFATAVAPTYTEGSEVKCSTTLAGEIRMSGGGGGGGTSSTFGAAFPATGTAAGYFDGTNMQGARVFDLDTGGGTEYVAGAALRCSAAGGSTECLPATATSADGLANITASFLHGYGYMYNGVTWDRIRGTIAGGLLSNVSNAFLLDATFTGRFPAGSTPADNESNAVTISRIGNFNFIFDGAAWDRWTGAVSQSGIWSVRIQDGVGNALASSAVNNPTTTQQGLITRSFEIGATTATLTNVNDSATNVTLLSSNVDRLGGTIYNDSDQTLYVKFGVTASTTSFTAKVFPDGYYELPKRYLGQIDGIWASDSTGAARITELTP